MLRRSRRRNYSSAVRFHAGYCTSIQAFAQSNDRRGAACAPGM